MKIVALFLFLLASTAAFSQTPPIQSNSINSTFTSGTASCVVPYSLANVAGDTLILAVEYFTNNNSATLIPAVADTNTNVWVQMVDIQYHPVAFDVNELSLFKVNNAHSGSNTVTYSNTATIPSGFNGTCYAAILEYGQLGTSPTLVSQSHTTFGGGLSPVDQINTITTSASASIESDLPLSRFTNFPTSIYLMVDIGGISNDLILFIASGSAQINPPGAFPELIPPTVGAMNLRQYQPPSPAQATPGIAVYDASITKGSPGALLPQFFVSNLRQE